MIALASARGIGDTVAGLGRRWRLLIAALCGILATAALPPLSLWYLLPLAFTVLLWLSGAEESLGRTFRLGWAFGTAHFATGLYWVAHSMLVDPERFAWMIPFAVGGLGAGLGLFPALALLACRWAAPGAPRVLAFAGAWTVLEWVRSWFLTGFPWNMIGHAWDGVPVMLQGASLLGALGLSFVTVLAAASPAAIGRTRQALALAPAAILLLGTLVFGWLRLPDAPPPVVQGVTLRLVQPNINQRDKWNQDRRPANFLSHVALTEAPAARRPTAVIWPETALTYPPELHGDVRERLDLALPPGTLLITGIPRFTGTREDYEVWNSLVVYDKAIRPLAAYDKFHLVPFGEYTPMEPILGPLKLTPGSKGFSAGPGPRSLKVQGLPPFSPLICYEAIFPGAVVDPTDRPGWLLNVTNDGWFGYSAGPFQHFTSARLRAVEEGLPLVRVANTGISGVIDPYGRVTDRLGLEERGVLDAALPQPLEPTLFATLGNWPALGMGALSLLLGLWLGRPRA